LTDPVSTYRYDPELLPVVAQLPHRDLARLDETRAAVQAAAAAAPRVDVTGVEVVQAITREGVGLRVYRPERRPNGRAPRPTAALLHAHPGGFVMCSIDTTHARMVELVRAIGVTAVSVDYRLAPEHPWPAAADDVYAALGWLASQAVRLGVDATRIALHGTSAGGALVAAAALRARDEGGPAVCFQYLGFPVLDDRLQTDSMRRFVDTPLWDSGKAAISWDAYLGAGVRGTAGVSPYAAPARAADLRGLPPTYISAMEFDPLRDEAVAYATRLLAAGVPTELHVFPGTYHGSSMVTHPAISRREAAEEIAVLRRALGWSAL